MSYLYVKISLFYNDRVVFYFEKGTKRIRDGVIRVRFLSPPSVLRNVPISGTFELSYRSHLVMRSLEPVHFFKMGN